MPFGERRGSKGKFAAGRVAVGRDGGEADRAGVDRLAIFRPDERRIVSGIAGIRELHDETELHRPRLFS